MLSTSPTLPNVRPAMISLMAAITIAGVCCAATAAQAPPAPERAQADLTGYWTQGLSRGLPISDGEEPADSKVIKAVITVRKGKIQNLTNDNTLIARSGDNLPVYKPEFWGKVQDLDFRGNKEDPSTHCMPPGVPRMGPPLRIIQTPQEVIFFYPGQASHHDFRMIHTDGRPHNPANLLDDSWNGDSVGRWDGDTQVVETMGLSEDSWLTAYGTCHSDALKVTERFRREGNQLNYSVTVEDPKVLLKPWVTQTMLRPLPINAGEAALAETLPCSERDSDHIVGPEREG